MSKQATRFFKEGWELPEINDDDLWLIIHGVIKSYTINQTGNTVILGFWGQQEVVGKSLSSVEPYFLECLSDVQAIAIPAVEWDTISNNLLERIHQIQQLSYIISNPQISERIWLLLQWLGTKFGNDVLEGQLINFNLTPQDLGDALGIEKMVVIQMLDLLEQEERILQLENQRIVLQQQQN